jgi:purine-nucleoside phosphorylase
LVYVVTALKSEAQAFVDKYKLTKSSLKNYTLFSNETMKVVVSGIGVENSRLATQTLINQFDITDDDSYINIGVCGASSKHKVGKLLQIGAIIYENIVYPFGEGVQLHCKNEEINQGDFEAVDMESYGFYDAVIHNPAIKNFAIYKVVSDHYEPESLTKDMVKSLLFKQLDTLELF